MLLQAASATIGSHLTAARIAYAGPVSDEFVARFAAATDPAEKLALIRALAPPWSPAVLATLADALADESWAFVEPPGWEQSRDSVDYAAARVLKTVGAAAEPMVAAKLDHASARCRDHAARVLAELPALAPATIDALLHHAGDRSLAYLIGRALRGKLDARPLLDFPETRRAGFVASIDLEPAWLAVLLDEPDLRVDVLGRIADLVPPPHELAAVVLPYVRDPDRDVAHAAVRALVPLAPDDAAITAALLAAIVERHDHAPWRGLAQRPAEHLLAHVPELLALLRGGVERAAYPLGALGGWAPSEVALALGHELAVGRWYFRILITALEQLGVAALPALPAVIAAAQDLEDDEARQAAGELAERLRAMRP